MRGVGLYGANTGGLVDEHAVVGDQAVVTDAPDRYGGDRPFVPSWRVYHRGLGDGRGDAPFVDDAGAAINSQIFVPTKMARSPSFPTVPHFPSRRTRGPRSCTQHTASSDTNAQYRHTDTKTQIQPTLYDRR